LVGGCILIINGSDEPAVCSAKSGNSEAPWESKGTPPPADDAKCLTVIMGEIRKLAGENLPF